VSLFAARVGRILLTLHAEAVCDPLLWQAWALVQVDFGGAGGGGVSGVRRSREAGRQYSLNA
jgi:hypothetical protein